MPHHRGKLGVIFSVCTVLMALGSCAASLMELLVFLSVGWENRPFDFLLVLTIASTLGLVAGAFGLFAGAGWANLVVLLSCLYIPVAFVVLTAKDFTPPAAWWPLLPLSLVEMLFGFIGLRAKAAATTDSTPSETI
jgi:hypothetical protein